MKDKQIKKAKKFKKKRLSIYELNAVQTLYFNKLTIFDVIKTIAMPVLGFGAVTHLIIFYWPATIMAALIGLIFGLVLHLPNTIKKNYYFRSYVERNRFINNVTQLIVNEKITFLDVLEKIIPRLTGELYKDMTMLLAKLNISDIDSASSQFNLIVEKYKEDVVFCQFFEQLETTHTEGRTNISTFKELKGQHNDMLEKLQDFENDKPGQVTMFILTLVIGVGVILLSTLSFGLEQYLTTFAHKGVGFLFSGIYLLINFIVYYRMMKYYYDTSITTL